MDASAVLSGSFSRIHCDCGGLKFLLIAESFAYSRFLLGCIKLMRPSLPKGKIFGILL
jgi:hypothetical protein